MDSTINLKQISHHIIKAARYALPTVQVESCSSVSARPENSDDSSEANLLNPANTLQVFAPCRGVHCPEKILFRREQEFCARVASNVSKLPLSTVPEVCIPVDGADFARAAARGKHQHFLRNYDASEYAGKEFGFELTAGQMSSYYAVYLFEVNQIILHPDHHRFVDIAAGRRVTRLYTTHEMAHAIQAENFPHIMEKQFSAQKRSIELNQEMFDGLIKWVTEPKTLGDLFSAPSQMLQWRNKMQIFQRDILTTSILLEGHASWVQRQCEATIFPVEPGLIGMARDFAYRYSIDITRSPLRFASPYSVGLKLITAVHQLQQDFEAKPFFDFSGRLVSLKPSLQRDGLLKMLFNEPLFVNELAPYFHTGWFRSTKEFVTVEPLRQRIIQMTDHPRV